MTYRAKVKRSVIVAGALALAGLGACSLSRGAPQPQYFILGGEATAADTLPSRTDLSGKSVGLRRLQLASYLGTQFIVVRRGSEEMTLSEFNRWGEPLEAGISRAVAGYLTAWAPFEAVDVAPWPARIEHDYLIELNVLRFEGVAPASEPATAGEVHMLVEWLILRPGDGVVVSRGTSDFRQRGWVVDDHSGLVALLNSGLRTLSADLLTQLSLLAAEARGGPDAPFSSAAADRPGGCCERDR